MLDETSLSPMISHPLRHEDSHRTRMSIKILISVYQTPKITLAFYGEYPMYRLGSASVVAPALPTFSDNSPHSKDVSPDGFRRGDTKLQVIPKSLLATARLHLSAVYVHCK